jgi:hypothetical protein
MFDLDNICPLNFLVKHSKTCFPWEIVASCSLVELILFSMRDIVPWGNLNPLLLDRTWCGLPFYFLHEAFELKKLFKGYFLFINFIHGKTKKQKKKN